MNALRGEATPIFQNAIEKIDFYGLVIWLTAQQVFTNLTQYQRKGVYNNNVPILILTPLTSYHLLLTFAYSNILTSFNTHPHMIFQWGNDIVSSS